MVVISLLDIMIHFLALQLPSYFPMHNRLLQLPLTIMLVGSTPLSNVNVKSSFDALFSFETNRNTFASVFVHAHISSYSTQ